MPELPDLQAFSRNLTKRLAGKKVKSIVTPYKKRLKTPEAELQRALVGRVVKEVTRQGKELHFHFRSGDILALHLMLRGNLYYFEGDDHEKKYPILEMMFTDKTGLVMTDFQGQATPTLNPDEHEGIDALSDELTLAFVKAKFEKSKAAIKNLLLDQHFIRGIGNAYADEILWHAGISPFSVTNKIPDKYIKQIVKLIPKVLRDAEKKILKSNPEIITGEVRDFLLIHNAKNTHSPTGAAIKVQLKGGRKTYFTDEQELFA
ncbi:MAG TPA: DNA-formamidopyrimidine glycosylase family protein [Chryseosolibacter sp.]|nr:DNA-formamidopyrimidine glycosylase family protein [Chryseosolibacter sp.]